MKDLFSKFTDFDSLEFTLWSNDISINKILFQYFNSNNSKVRVVKWTSSSTYYLLLLNL